MRRLEARLVDDVRALRRRDPRGALLLVVPSRLLGARLTAGLARALGGLAGVHALTLPELAERVALLPLALAGRRPLPAVADRLLVDRAIREAVPPADGYFSGVLAARNFPAAVLRTLLDVKRAGLAPADLETALPGSAKARELAASYRALESAITRHGYYDASDLLIEATRLVDREPGRLDAAAVLAFGFVELNPLETRLLEACARATTVVRYAADAEAADLPAPAAIEIVAAPGEEREVREIARVVLRHVQAGGRLDEVGILLRQPAAYLPAVRDVFAAAGIPYTLGTAPAVGETRAGRSLRLLVEVCRSDFARATVMEFLGFAHLRQRPGTSPAEWERLSRQAGIVGGAREWRERLDRLGRRLEPAPEIDEDDEEHRARRAHDRDALGALRRAVRILLRGLARLPDPASVEALVDAVTRTFRRLVETSPEAELALGALARLRELGAVDAAVPLEELWTLLETALAAPSAAGPAPEPGRVFVGELGVALGVDFPLTIVPGMVEGGFPAAPRQDPILLDAERRQLTGLPLAQDVRELERVRFALAVGSGAGRVVLSYPRIDAESGRPRVPSFLVLDLLEAVTGERHDFETLEAFPGWRSVPLHPAPASARERPLDEREWLVTRAVAARRAPEPLLRQLPGARRGLEAIRSREGTDILTAYDGLLPRGVDPGAAPLTPTALERYASCPFRFLLERVYGLEAVEEPDRILTINPRDRGDLVHAVLETTFRRLAERELLPLTHERLGAAREALDAAFAVACADAERRGVTGLPALWQGEQARLREELRSAIEAEADDPAGWRPALFEIGFGVKGTDGAPAAPLVYQLPDGTTLSLRGRIDRVDVSPDGQRARVLDYKTGKVRSPRTPDRLAKGRALQLPVYRLAAEQALTGGGAVRVDEAQYYHVVGPDAGTRVRFTRAGWEARRADFDRALATIVGGIRAGRFFQRPGACARGPCAFDLACGAERGRWAEAKRADPAVLAHEALETIE
ncbi:MAG TPA: PD-(D/E)XK nuclease family protein [Methylomirabilota bacterium]